MDYIHFQYLIMVEILLMANHFFFFILFKNLLFVSIFKKGQYPIMVEILLMANHFFFFILFKNLLFVSIFKKVDIWTSFHLHLQLIPQMHPINCFCVLKFKSSRNS